MTSKAYINTHLRLCTGDGSLSRGAGSTATSGTSGLFTSTGGLDGVTCGYGFLFLFLLVSRPHDPSNQVWVAVSFTSAKIIVKMVGYRAERTHLNVDAS